MTKIPIISPSEYRTLLKSSVPRSRVVPVDATWYMPNSPKDAKDEFLNQERIPNAAFFDVDGVSTKSEYPHMLPSGADFQKAVKSLGIQKSDRVVVYDKAGIFSSPRAAWTFSLFGHKSVYLLDNYIKYNQPLDKEPVSLFATPLKSESPEESHELETSNNYSKQVVEYEELLDLVSSGRLQKEYYLFDARPYDRYTGKSPEPREGLSSGHVPGSFSLPFPTVLNGDKGFKSREELLEIFKTRFNLDLSSRAFLGDKKGIIAMCGSGVTAVILKFAIESVIGVDVDVRVYDGSWTEWASRAPAEYIVKGEK